MLYPTLALRSTDVYKPTRNHFTVSTCFPPFPNVLSNSLSAVHKALSSSPASVVVVHFVAGSKTGICSPSERVLTEMQERYGERLLVS